MILNTRQATDVSKNEDRGGKYLVSQMDREEVGIHVLKVRNIMGIPDITSIPQRPLRIQGAINLRGKVIPDLSA